MARLAEETTEEFRTEVEALHSAGEAQARPHPLDDPAVTRVSVTIAILAVVGVILGSLESMESGAASRASADALIYQNRSADAWAALDARMVRAALDQAPTRAGDAAPATLTLPPASRYAGQDDAALTRFAQQQEALSLARLEEVATRDRRHHILTWAVMLVQIAIAIATLSIIARPRRWPWLTGVGLGAVGALVGVAAFLL